MIDVRRATLADQEEVLAMLKHIWDDDYLPYMWVKWVESPKEGVVLIAEADNKIVGTSYVHFLPNNISWFQGMRVDPQARRIGVGSVLTKAALDVARQSGCTHAYLGIDADNTASLTMTAKAGFRKICDYSRMGYKIAPLEAEVPQAPTLWREATKDDIDSILSLGQLYSSDKAIFACWQWQPLCRSAMLQVIEEHYIWVWGGEKISVWAGFADHGSYRALFPVCGEETAAQEALLDMLAWLKGPEEIFLELWQHPADRLLNTAKELGFEGDDGYTIWGYSLTTPC